MSRKSNREAPFISEMGTGWEIWMAIVHAVTDNDPENADARLRALKKDPEKLAAVAMLINGKSETKHQPVETITVPDLPAKALLALVEEQAGLTHLNSDYQKYAFIRDERGKTYEVLTWKSGRCVSSDAVREHFKALGSKGNTAAFISWVAKNHPTGWYVSIPEDGECFVYGGGLYAPYFDRVDSTRKLSLYGLADDWLDDYVFVGFREVSSK